MIQEAIIMASKKTNPPAELIFSRSNSTTTGGATRRHFHWSSTTNKVTTSEEPEEDILETLKNQIHTASAYKTISSSSSSAAAPQQQTRRKKLPVAVSRIRSVVMSAITSTYAQYKPSQLRLNPRSQQLGTKVIGTLFGHRKGHVNFVFQREHNTSPVFFVELATSITSLVKEMASGLVRIALECDKVASSTSSLPQQQQQKQQEVNDEQEGEFEQEKAATTTRSLRRRKITGMNRRRDGGGASTRLQLVEEASWRAYCNGKKCGFAVKREPGPRELKILKAVEPISMGAGVLPGFNGEGLSGPDGELMYMRAKFERVVGSRDSEAFYMMNPDSNGAPELSLYLLRL